ncbi:MAG TPA: hypothetical protein VFD59_14580 [Nocardioidaceae bacterium]|nr:hypothetical protein [Nocardioidaceae bacterium]
MAKGTSIHGSYAVWSSHSSTIQRARAALRLTLVPCPGGGGSGEPGRREEMGIDSAQRKLASDPGMAQDGTVFEQTHQHRASGAEAVDPD